MPLKSLAALFLLIVASVSLGASKPNFSGEWQLNLSKSSYGEMPAPTSLMRKITHTDPFLEIIDDQNGGGRTGVRTRNYTVGKTTTFEINGATVEGSAAWEGASLIVSTKVDSVGLLFKDKMTLSADGKQLTSDVQIDSSKGTSQVKLVFDRL